MLSVIQGTTSNDTQGALAILQTLSVDSKYKARLEELQAQAKKASDALEALRAAEQVAERKLEATEAMQNSMIAEATHITNEAQDARQQAERLHAQVAVRESALSKAVAEHEAQKKAAAGHVAAQHKARMEELNDKQASIDVENDKVIGWRAELVTTAKQLDARQAYLDKAAAEHQAKAAELAKYDAALRDIASVAYTMVNTLQTKTADLVK
jgi:chromosome segregation ATPase